VRYDAEMSTEDRTVTQPPTPASKIEAMPDVRDLLNQVSAHLQESTAEFRSLKQAVQAFDGRIANVEQRIDGSKPPPPGAPPIVRILGDVAATASKAGASASQHDLDVPALRAELAEVRTELRAQSNWMGLGKKGARWLLSARGLKTCAQIATLAGALYAAFQASAHAHPAPSSPVVLPESPGSR
jgi:hypothetical protein